VLDGRKAREEELPSWKPSWMGGLRLAEVALLVVEWNVYCTGVRTCNRRICNVIISAACNSNNPTAVASRVGEFCFGKPVSPADQKARRCCSIGNVGYVLLNKNWEWFGRRILLAVVVAVRERL
jgi:hypothetical protein